jgi:chromosome segregation ATPase
LVALLVSGCATSQQNSALECGAGGAVASALICKLAGGSNAQCAGVGVLTGAIGATACYAYADSLEKRRQELAGKENDLNARLRYVHGINDDAEKLNDRLRSRVTEVTQAADKLVITSQSGRMSQRDLQSERQKLDGELKSANEQLLAEGSAVADMKQYRARNAVENAELDADIVKQDQLYRETQRQITALANQRQRF